MPLLPAICCGVANRFAGHTRPNAVQQHPATSPTIGKGGAGNGGERGFAAAPWRAGRSRPPQPPSARLAHVETVDGRSRREATKQPLAVSSRSLAGGVERPVMGSAAAPPLPWGGPGRARTHTHPRRGSGRFPGGETRMRIGRASGAAPTGGAAVRRRARTRKAGGGAVPAAPQGRTARNASDVCNPIYSNRIII